MSQTKQKAFDEAFPAPAPRDNQDVVIKKAVKLFQEGKEVVAIDAPPGFGKSITLYTIAKMLDDDAFYATPLKSLQEQLTSDEFVGGDVIEIMGRSNYHCIHHDADDDTMVDRGPCQKESNFECEYYHECPYYSQKTRAINHWMAVMNMSYLMAEGHIDPMAEMSFGNRDMLILDECQSIEDWAISFVGFTISPYTIPDIVINDIGGLPDEKHGEDVKWLTEWLKDEVLESVVAQAEMYSGKPVYTDSDMDIIEKLSEFETKVRRFLDDIEEHEWVANYDWRIRKNRDNYASIELKPVRVGRFLDSLLWNRADRFILSSATIPGNDWFDEIGLGDKVEEGKVARIPVPSPFPVENRPIITGHTVGKFTYGQREENMPAAVEKIKAISEHHGDEKGIIHCRSYGISKLFKEAANNKGYGQWLRDNVMFQNRKDREGSLEDWINGDKQVFMSVNMAEGIDLKYDKCRWQALLKVLYPYMDNRVKKRKEVAENKGDQSEFWDWYNQKAITQIEQAYGRAVRADDDEAIFYILDESANGLIQRSAEQFHKWFLDGVNEGYDVTESGVRVDAGRGI